MSTSIYLVSSNKIHPEDALAFLADLNAVNIDKERASGLIAEGNANIWIKFLGTSVLEESDEEELDAWSNYLGKDACSFFELTIGKGEGGMQLAVKVARESMQRWRVVVDDLYDFIYCEENLDEILNS
ncbi:hypothetical protein O5O45_23365 [Hahella aquimaris]|uniref:hypothetical protein n=1 Tax=Hahella sp. HNIBRBA332 TaxID=3015983 RepID=UPI00273C67D8|nr:hypothetical protein [Hahella sp. HNIBRBA332]WLQ12672.1 hypothetical protein O5O45_23365 [Hahella sp. HNIBRBA332]